MDFLKDLIAGVVVVEQRGQKLRPSEGVELERELDEILGGIREADDLRAADESLDRLGRFQTELARACFKWDIALPVRLRRLVREFDRSDDSDVRSRTFRQIKEGVFLS
jgi:hypothetical protein